jgi:hypothetical protein
MLVSFERKEEDKSLGPGECKEAISPNCANGKSASVRAAQRAHDVGQADIGTENGCCRDNGIGKSLMSVFKVLHMEAPR